MRKLLSVPLRLAIGWGISPRVLGLIGTAMLVLLRLTIGWHFHSEGVDKYQQGNWDATPFFANAKGPFADHFRNLVWDSTGEYRTHPEFMNSHFAKFIDDAAYYYSMDEEKVARSNDALKSTMIGHQDILDRYSVELMEYRKGLEDLGTEKSAPAWSGVSSLAGQVATKRKDLNQKIKPVFDELNQLWDGFEARITAIGLENFRVNDPPTPLPLEKFPTSYPDTNLLSKFVPYFDLAIGWCLLLGFFTPIAALAAACFLGSVFLSQYPPTTGPNSSMYQLIECMACLVLAGTGAGRFAGLDYFLHLFVRRGEARKAT